MQLTFQRSQGNEPTDFLIGFERAAVNAVTNQMP